MALPLLATAGALAALLGASAGRASSETLVATVGPDYNISLTTSDGGAVGELEEGTYTIVVHDRSAEHSFHLFGPGVDANSGVEYVGDLTWTVELSPGGYQFFCDPHEDSMAGGFSVRVASTTTGTTTTDTTTTTAPISSEPTPAPPAPPARAADLAVTLAGSSDPVSVGDWLGYSFEVANGGPDGATEVTLTTVLPDSVTPVSATASQGSCAGARTVVCLLGDVAVGANATVQMIVVPEVAGKIVTRAATAARESDPVSSNNSAAATTIAIASAPAAKRLSVSGVRTHVHRHGRFAHVTVQLAVNVPATVDATLRRGKRRVAATRRALVPGAGSLHLVARRPAQAARHALEVRVVGADGTVAVIRRSLRF